MSDPTLIAPCDVEDLLIEVILRRHPEHLAAQERRRGLKPETLERLKAVRHLAAQEAFQSGDTMPACLVGSLGTAAAPARNEDDAIDVTLRVALEVAVMGRSRRDTLRRRDITAWTVIECVLQRTPRLGIVSAIQLVDVETVEFAQAQSMRGHARASFEVTVPSAASMAGLPADDALWTPGSPGGPPPDGEPYAPPVPLPPVTAIDAEILREGIAP
ncbi:hypothetical protein [Miltoncostaea marina]|uniref:hypothetical protein n=1 Tax=Miltoncostaea marina TaxID=2843215 RepID=UPI001C3DFE56|nr:hypothetical protein [Miltoncostaea marina]